MTRVRQSVAKTTKLSSSKFGQREAPAEPLNHHKLTAQQELRPPVRDNSASDFELRKLPFPMQQGREREVSVIFAALGRTVKAWFAR